MTTLVRFSIFKELSRSNYYLQNSTITSLSLFLATSSKFFPTRTLTGFESQSSGTSSVIKCGWNRQDSNSMPIKHAFTYIWEWSLVHAGYLQYGKSLCWLLKVPFEPKLSMKRCINWSNVNGFLHCSLYRRRPYDVKFHSNDSPSPRTWGV